ncbi:hypothetical protein [Streptomyces atriruber]|uniref:hypothetical protein n=1 Tax=Streptomyces atriruber TaxID=545121 RepID=UPI0006E21D7C|nr:hypothetical protein [Streptomyces atriruber]
MQVPDGAQSPDPGLDPLDRLTQAASELLGELESLGRDTGRQFTSLARTSRQNRRMIWALVISLTLTAALTVGSGIALVRVDRNADGIDALTRRLDVAQTDTRRRAFCPLYEIFLSSKSAQGRKAASDPKAYDHAFEVIGEGHRALKCAEFTSDKAPFGATPKG